MTKQDKIKSFLKDSFINQSIKVLSIRVGGVVLYFCLALFLTNFFSASQVGKYEFARSILLIIGSISLLGTDQSIIYYSGILNSSNRLGELKSIYKKMLMMSLGISFGLFILLWMVPKGLIYQSFEDPEATTIIYKTFLTITVFVISLLNIDTLRALNKTLFSELYRNIFRHLVFFILAITLFYTGYQTWLTDFYLLGFVILAVTSSIRVYKVFRAYKDYKLKNDFSYKDILKRSYPMALSSIAYFLMQSVDIILLSKLTNFKSVAYYGAAVKTSLVISIVLLSINIVIAPKIAELYTNNDFVSLKKLIKKSTQLILLISIPALLVLFMLSQFILSLFGEDYVVAKHTLWVLLLGQLFNSLCGPVAAYLNMTGKQKILQYALFIGLFTNVTLNWLLIPKYSIFGAGLATLISIITWTSLSVIYVYKKDGIKTFKV